MFPYLRLGPYLLPLSGLAALLGVWLGLLLSEREAKRFNLRPEDIYNLVLVAILSGIIAARLFYAGRYLGAYMATPGSLFALNTNTLSPLEGALTGLLAAFIYGQRKSLPLRPVLDSLAPGLGVFLVFVGVAHLSNGEAFGAPAQIPWSIYLWNEYRHPSQAYEILTAFAILWIVLRRPLGQPGAGQNFLLLVALSAGARLFLEAFRGDSLIWSGGLRVTQLVSLFILLAALWLIQRWRQIPEHAAEKIQV